MSYNVVSERGALVVTKTKTQDDYASFPDSSIGPEEIAKTQLTETSVVSLDSASGIITSVKKQSNYCFRKPGR